MKDRHRGQFPRFGRAVGNGWLFAALLGAIFSAGCAPIALWREARNLETVPQVVALPDGYDSFAPREPYNGPLPSERPYQADVSQFPVRLGEVGPIDYSLGELQYPFACETEESRLGPPQVDNQRGWGTPVYEKNGVLKGYSKDCLLPTRAGYYYHQANTRKLFPLMPDTDPATITRATVNGEEVPFIVRVEQGTINRFIYLIVVLADPANDLKHPSGELWNKKLIYYFRGGVGIGKRQGATRVSTATSRRLDDLANGYAVAYSSGTRTKTHYNVRLAGVTAAMVIAQFEALYGKPDYTVAIGESGGAVQQYLIAQNQPGLLDALIPIYSYPDMISQTIWAFDCELLEYYFDVTAKDQRRWRDQEQRSLVMGLAADNEVVNYFNRLDTWSRLIKLRMPRMIRGATECSLSWRGLIPLTNNPTFTSEFARYKPAVMQQTRFSHWHDLKDFYGTDQNGYAHRTFDNEGVQYGLGVLVTGALTPVEFLHLNAHIGSWKHPKDMRPERFWLVSGDDELGRLSIWSHHNMRTLRSKSLTLKQFETANPSSIPVAPRNRGNANAIQAAYDSGHVFMGGIDLPIIDARHYLDDQLDMHHSFASLSVRARLQRATGNSDNMLIWMSEPDYNATSRALALLDTWLQNGKPPHAQDACFSSSGAVIAQGDTVWDGHWNGKPSGACTQRFPQYRSPRNVAGAPITGDTFKCELQPVEDALHNGTYGPVDMAPFAAHLARIFPTGVCRYRTAS